MVVREDGESERPSSAKNHPRDPPGLLRTQCVFIRRDRRSLTKTFDRPRTDGRHVTRHTTITKYNIGRRVADWGAAVGAREKHARAVW